MRTPPPHPRTRLPSRSSLAYPPHRRRRRCVDRAGCSRRAPRSRSAAYHIEPGAPWPWPTLAPAGRSCAIGVRRRGPRSLKPGQWRPRGARVETGRCGAGYAAPPSAAGRAALRLATECHWQWPSMLAPPGPRRCRRLRSDATRHSGGSRAPQHGERAFQRCDVPPIPLDPPLPPSVSNGRP